ncbi:MAG: EamA family transporter [Burkholderiaceae bacterium]|jgi:drug/metabolite transporter (DMT)-like permease|nr:EamA family transporter [Burkholderiaceae bacterium]
MKLQSPRWQPGVLAALASAFLFGAGTPLAKWLLGQMSPWMLAGLLYLGSGIGLGLYRWWRGAARPRLNPGEMRWLLAAVLCGGGIAPVLLMAGLSAMPASQASLLLNAEAVLTALLAWGLFKENVDKRIAIGMAAIVAGALLLSWAPGEASAATPLWPALAVLLACLFWALDNNFTRKVALADAAWIAGVKGLVAGATNLLLAFLAGAALPGALTVSAAMAVGLVAYGVSLALFVVALRHLGASRAGAYFSTAPFVGALFSVLFLAEPVTWPLLAAALLMAFGIWLHLTEHHAHAHAHDALEHDHLHAHPDPDGHHSHAHVPAFEGQHSHRHRHEALHHSHAHYPDAHHRHSH